MKITNLTEDSKLYTSNVFLVMGEWNTVDDMTTLIDVGYDSQIIQKIMSMNMGLGKQKIDQVILTHSHSDHAALLPAITEAFHPKVYAFNSYLKGIDGVLKDGDSIRIGEKQFEIFHITAHSYDSICLYCAEDCVLFAGDTHFPIEFENTKLEEENANAISRLKEKHIKTVYYGHGGRQDFTDQAFQILKNENKIFT